MSDLTTAELTILAFYFVVFFVMGYWFELKNEKKRSADDGYGLLVPKKHGSWWFTSARIVAAVVAFPLIFGAHARMWQARRALKSSSHPGS